MKLKIGLIVTLELIRQLGLDKSNLTMQHELIERPAFLLIFVFCEHAGQQI